MINFVLLLSSFYLLTALELEPLFAEKQLVENGKFLEAYDSLDRSVISTVRHSITEIRGIADFSADLPPCTDYAAEESKISRFCCCLAAA